MGYTPKRLPAEYLTRGVACLPVAAEVRYARLVLTAWTSHLPNDDQHEERDGEFGEGEHEPDHDARSSFATMRAISCFDTGLPPYAAAPAFFGGRVRKPRSARRADNVV